MRNHCHHELRNDFRRILQSQTCISTASVFDPLSARIAADLGFEVGILGGSVASLQVLGAPDVTLITLSEFAEQAARIGRVARLPIIADADHGYGNALNVMRTVTELERAGVAAITIEDTLLPARFGGRAVELIGLDEAVGKLRAAKEARADTSLAIVARTHAGAQSLTDVIKRTRAFEQSGADAICLVGVKHFESLAAIADGLSTPIMLITYGNSELRDAPGLADLGTRIVVDGHMAYFAAVQATFESLRAQRNPNSTASECATTLVKKYALQEIYSDQASMFMQFPAT
ncbi:MULTISPECIES: isocitrate lyase/PEP mutase family protein [Pseudomonas]|uniref:isocitrate lyase/PEP mutase family protein n=1 Tax=Pseudomonas TaxID=286 RepID=UPI00224B7FBA|nr:MULTISPECIES: isocitrate lyase/PEP mutase family protein [unclassified Pseudomonas]MCX2890203.1 isocitrate lyase/PEP mutase family protein [Pseudomonas sp. DCB_BI]MDH4552183.1 isocitrate lyase/PEP mutase family protein [Pseudomonas sp. BN607]